MISRICIALIAVVAATLFAQGSQDADQKKIVELMNKRRDILRQRLDVLQEKYRSGQTQIMAVISARDDLYEAELELVSAKKERVRLSELRFKNLLELEKITEQRFSQGVGTKEDYLVATAARLKAEIDYLRQRAKPD